MAVSRSDLATKLDTQVVGNVGLYYCCYKLSLLGWNVMPTARNARGVDIIAYNAEATKLIGIQVKSLSKRNPVPLGKTLDKIMGNWWIVINNIVAEPQAFIMRPKEVRDFAVRSGSEGNYSYWLAAPNYDTPKFKEAWKRIGTGHKRNEIPGNAPD